MSFEGKNLKEMGKWTEDIYMILEKKIWTLGAGLPQPRGSKHEYYHNIQKSSLKSLGQTSCGASLGKRNKSLYIYGPCHMTKMAAMAINSKNF